MIPIPDVRPCYVPGTPADVYHADRDSASASVLKLIASRTPAHARAAMLATTPDTPALAFGRLVHSVLLDGVDWTEAPALDRRTKAGKEAAAEFAAANEGRLIVGPADAEKLRGMLASIDAHPAARGLLKAGQPEVSGWFTDPVTGAPCRIRPDYLRDDGRLIADLKAADDASPAGFARAAARYGYHLQAALYADGHRVITGEDADFVFLAVEKSPPYAVGLYRLDDDAMDLGRRQYRRALAIWQECQSLGDWPGYSGRIEHLTLPPWAWSAMPDDDAQDGADAEELAALAALADRVPY